MKKTFYFSAVVVSLLMVSCKKDYTCSCVYTSTQTYTDEDGDEISPPANSVSNSSIVIREKEKDAKAKCEGSNGQITQSIQNGGIYGKQVVNTNCTLK